MRALKPMLVFAAWVAGILLAIGAVLKAFFVDVVVVGHDGMAPTLLYGEQVLLWRDASLEVPAITVCEHPRRPGELVIGRIVATAGQTVRAPRGRLEVAGRRPEADVRERVRYVVSPSGAMDEVKRVIETLNQVDYEVFWHADDPLYVTETEVEPGRLYLLGDNRPYLGHDSRSFGTVDRSTCRGAVFMRWTTVDDQGADLGHHMLQIIH